LYFGQPIFFYAEIIRKGFISEIINRNKSSDIMVRYEEKPWDKKNYDEQRPINDIFTDIDSVSSTNNAVELYPIKRQRKEKKLYDPDSGNLEGEFVGNEIYQQKKKKNQDDQKEKDTNELESSVTDFHTLSYDQHSIENNFNKNQKRQRIENNEEEHNEITFKKRPGRPKRIDENNEVEEKTNTENMRFTIKKLGRPKKIDENIEEMNPIKRPGRPTKSKVQLDDENNELSGEMRANEENPLPPKKKLGRPRKDTQVIVEQNSPIVDDGKRKRKKKEFFEPNHEKETRKKPSTKTFERASIEYRIEKILNKTSASIMNDDDDDDGGGGLDSNDKSKRNNPKHKNTKGSDDFLNCDLTSRSIDFLLASCDFSSAVPVKKCFHGRYLDSHFKKALLHYLYFWWKPPEISVLTRKISKEKFKKTEKSGKSNISVAEIQEILFFCPVDVMELNTLKRGKRLLEILVTEDCTLGKLLTDRIRKFLRNRNCYDDRLRAFLYPHNVANLSSIRLNAQISELKSMNLKIPLSATCFSIIMNFVLKATSKNNKYYLTDTIIESTSMGKTSVFLDLSCGTGIQTIQVAAMTGCKCYGLVSDEASLITALKIAEKFHDLLIQLNIKEALKIEFIKSDVFDSEIDDLFLSSNVIFWDNLNVKEEEQTQFTSKLSRIYADSYNIKQLITRRNLSDKNGERKEPSRELTLESGSLNIYYIAKESFPIVETVSYSLERCPDTNDAFSNGFEFIDECPIVEENSDLSATPISTENLIKRVYKNQSIYMGEIKNNKRHGKGSLIYPQNSKSLRVTYEGEWFNDIIHGHGKMIYRDNEVYDGEWRNEIKHGTGTYEWPDGKVYKGTWVNGLMNGKGMLQYSKKESSSGRVSYEGDFKDDLPHGKGIIMFQNGSRYEGSIMIHSMKGTGALIYPPGDIRLRSAYIGSFLHDNFEGYGILKYTDGKKYEGHWNAGRKHGQGKFYYASDDNKKRIKFEGIFHKDKVNDGEMIYSDGRIYRGKWKHELPHGKGKAILPNVTYKGHWASGLPHGHGVLLNNADKKIIRQGEWKEGIYQINDDENLTQVYQEESIYFKEL